MKIFIKNMVCLRCLIVVKDEIERLDLAYDAVTMGIAILTDPVPAGKLNLLKSALLKSGLEIIETKKSILIEKIKAIVIETIHYSDTPPSKNFTTHLAQTLHHDYKYVAGLFAASQGITLQQYILINKIEKVKELLVYYHLTLAEIACKMEYSSAAHLSKQFKTVTGFTASQFIKKQKERVNQGQG